MNPNLYIKILGELSDYQSEIIEVILEQASIERDADLTEEQKAVEIAKLDHKEAIYQRRYNELFTQFTALRQQRDEINKIVTAAKLRLCHAFITEAA